MYILYEVHFPSQPVPGTVLRAAWKEAGLTGAPALQASKAGPAAIQKLVSSQLRKAGASFVSGGRGDMEVPDGALDLLERLERFYHRVYPETVASGRREHFQYERLEWLGQY